MSSHCTAGTSTPSSSRVPTSASGSSTFGTKRPPATPPTRTRDRRPTGFGVCVVTAGPGFTNALTPMTSAYVDAIPVVFIVGSPPLREVETNPLQGGIDQVAMAAPVTKWAHRITNVERLPDLIEKARAYRDIGAARSRLARCADRRDVHAGARRDVPSRQTVSYAGPSRAVARRGRSRADVACEREATGRHCRWWRRVLALFGGAQSFR